MAFTELADLDCSKTTAIGGRNTKTGKDNPTRLEGYYIGTRQVDSPKSKTGLAALHVFQTKEGNVGVWGKTNLDTKMRGVAPGAMTRVTFVGMMETKNNPMYKYKVEVDLDNVIDVAAAIQEASDNTGSDYSDVDLDAYPQDTRAEEAPPAPAPRRAAPPSAAAQDRVKNLLANRPKVN